MIASKSEFFASFYFWFCKIGLKLPEVLLKDGAKDAACALAVLAMSFDGGYCLVSDLSVYSKSGEIF